MKIDGIGIESKNFWNHPSMRARQGICQYYINIKKTNQICPTYVGKNEIYCKHHRDIIVRDKKKEKINTEIENNINKLSFYDWGTGIRTIKGERFSLEKYPFLVPIYRKISEIIPKRVEEKKSLKIVFRKGSQKGITELVISLVIYMAKLYGWNILYVLPDQSECKIFGSTRMNPAIEDIAIEGQLEINNMDVKRIGYGNIYLRGTIKAKSARMISSDMNIIDEKNECNIDVLAEYPSRMEGSPYKWEIDISTPTKPGKGIDLDFELGDQEHYFVNCGCGEWNCICCGYPDLWDEENGKWVCGKCGKELDGSMKTEWVASYFDKEIFGFHPNAPCSLDGTTFKKSKNDETRPIHLREKYLYNHLLGTSWSNAEEVFDEEIFYKCMDGRIKKEYINEGGQYFLGIDIGKYAHWILLKLWENGKLALSNWGKILMNAKDGHNLFKKEFEILHKQFKPTCGIIDAQPETSLVYDIISQYQLGQYWAGWYSRQPKYQLIPIEWNEKNKLELSILRNDSFDNMLNKFWTHQYILPKDENIIEIISAFKLMKKENTLDKNGNELHNWESFGRHDHYAHAFNLATIASQRQRKAEIYIMDTRKELIELHKQQLIGVS